METLVTGNTGYWTVEALKKAFGNSHIIITGERPEGKEDSKITCFPLSVQDERFDPIFDNYEFDRVVYVSGYLTYHGNTEHEMEELLALLRKCSQRRTEQFLFLTSQEVCSDVENGKIKMLRSEEELCLYYAEKYYLPVKIIRCPYLCSARNPQDYFYHLFERMEDEKKIEFQESPKQAASFIRLEEVAEFLFRLTDDWNEETEALNLYGAGNSTFEDLAAGLLKLCPGLSVTFGKNPAVSTLDLGEDVVRARYGWFAIEDVCADIAAVYQEFDREKGTELSLFGRFREKIMGLKPGLVLLELVVGWIGVEFLIRLLSSTAQFSSIDLRLLFIVVMGSVYGMNAGVTAAFFETIAAGIAYMERGLNWQTVFYEPSNWVPFILYFTVGAICGYVKHRNDDIISSLQREKAMLSDKYQFTRTLYQEALEYKSRYKKQIIGSRDSFGKIFEVVQSLDTTVPQEIYAQSISIMEDVLDNHSIAIYSIRNARSVFGRLEVSSRSMEGTLQKSILLEQFSAAMEVLETGEIWVNTDLLPDYPAYIAGVKNRSGELILMIMIYRAVRPDGTLLCQFIPDYLRAGGELLPEGLGLPECRAG